MVTTKQKNIDNINNNNIANPYKLLQMIRYEATLQISHLLFVELDGELIGAISS